MKKFALWLAAAAIVMGFNSCSDDPDHPDTNVLETPMMQAPQLTHNTAVLSWKKCANANMYVYTVNNGPEMMTYEPSVTLEGLTPETTYTFSVKARRDYSQYFEDSEYTTINFTTLGKPQTAKVYHVASFGDDWDTWFYEYNADWTPKRIYRTVDGTATGDLDREWNFTYNGTALQVRGKNDYDITLNDKGYVAQLIDGSTTYDYLYDADGYLIQVCKNGEVAVNCDIQDGNLMRWSKLKDGAEVWKLHTYDSSLNVGGCHAITAEGIGASRWFVESGLFGKACTNLHTSNQWDYSDTGSTFTFDFDANGCVTAEHKLYGSDTENFFYTYVAE